MFSVLPDLAPRDSHSLWYTSSRNPLASSTSGLLSPFDPSSLSSSSPDGLITTTNSQTNAATTTSGGSHGAHNSRHASRNIQAAIIERSLLGRLRADETYMERRKANVSNLGSTWLKPLGVSKTLFQMREEERERQEHEEAMRREEMLARELAEAEAAAAAVAAGDIGGNGTATVLEEGAARVEGGMEVADTNTIPGGTGGGGGGGGGDGDDMEMMEGDNDMDEMGGRDLDEEIPDADEGGFGYDGASDDDEEEDGEDEAEEEEATTDQNTTTGDHANEDDEDTVEAPQAPPTATSTGSSMRHHARNDNNNHQQQRELANVRANEERMREMMARGGLRPTHINLAAAGADEDDEDIDEEDRSHMLEEDDIIGTANNSYEDTEGVMMMDDSLGMNANLDDDIPDADQEEHAHQSGFYEHTDSEAELLDSDSDNEQEQVNTGRGGSGYNSNGGNIGNMSGTGSHYRRDSYQNRVSYGPGSGSGSSQGQHRRVSLPRQQQQQYQQGQRLLRASLAGSARRSTLGAPRSSLDISGLLSVDESSPMMRSSPRVRRMH